MPRVGIEPATYRFRRRTLYPLSYRGSEDKAYSPLVPPYPSVRLRALLGRRWCEKASQSSKGEGNERRDNLDGLVL